MIKRGLDMTEMLYLALFMIGKKTDSVYNIRVKIIWGRCPCSK